MAVRLNRLELVHGENIKNKNKKKVEIVTKSLSIETECRTVISKNADI
jgi:hypothetical protein